MSSFSTWVIMPEAEAKRPFFEYHNSSTYYGSAPFSYNLLEEQLLKGYIMEDLIAIGNFSFPNTKFYGAVQFLHFFKNSGTIGLDVKTKRSYVNSEVSIVRQLKNSKMITNYGFYPDFRTNSLVIGEYPHEYNTSYHRENLKVFRTTNEGDKVKWGLDFASINYGDEVVNKGHKTLLRIDYGFIIGSKDFRDKVISDYFDDLLKQKKCEKLTYIGLDSNYFSFQCDESIDKKKFKDVVFNVDNESKFVLKWDDVFYSDSESKGKVDFGIIFRSEGDGNWILGEIFFRKFPLFFDWDRKIIGCYFESREKAEKYSLVRIVGLVGLSVAILLVVYCCYRNYSRKRPRIQIPEDMYNELN